MVLQTIWPPDGCDGVVSRWRVAGDATVKGRRLPVKLQLTLPAAVSETVMEPLLWVE